MSKPMNEQVVGKLSMDEINAIEAERAHYEETMAVGIEALKIVQQHRGWVSDEALAAAAEYLGMAPAELDAVATFYNLIYRQPVGRQVIHYCNSASCWMMGADQVRERFCQNLGVQPGETSADGEYTLLPIVCLGACDHAPAVMIGNKLYHDVTPERVDEIIDSKQQEGR